MPIAWPNLEGRSPTLDATCIPVSRSEGQRSGSLGPLMLTHLTKGKAYELQTWYTDGGRRPASATGPKTFKVKGQGRKVTWSVWAVLAIAHKSNTNSRSVTKIGRRVPHDTCYIGNQFQGHLVKGQGHRPTNAQTHKMCHIFRTVRPKNYSKLVCGWRT